MGGCAAARTFPRVKICRRTQPEYGRRYRYIELGLLVKVCKRDDGVVLSLLLMCV